MYKALYREYRPEVFEEMLGQEHIVRILSNQIETDSTSHAYLFCGTRGTGKTTTARLLAKGLNCTSPGYKPCGVCDACVAIKDGNYLDVVEIDAASNNGVDNIRELRESVKYPPAAGKKKVYIIDEVHMLSTGAFNALLKTLEEPPEYVTFILATTEPEKLPATILSRCMRLDFKRVPENALISGMADICMRKGINVTEDALRIIAANADGSVRDGLSILDQCIAGGDLNVDAADVLDFLGASGEETFIELTDLVRRGKTADALIFLAKALEDGKDVKQFTKDWVNHFRNLLMTKYIANPQDVINMSVENIERIRHQSEVLELADINAALLELSRTYNEARRSTQPRILLELSIVKLSTGETGPVKAQATPSIARKAPAQQTRTVAPAEQAVDIFAKGASQSEPADAQPAAEGFDCAAVWKAVFDDAEAGKGSFYVLASDGRITRIGENDFSIEVSRAFQVRMAENNRDLIERLVAEHTDGKRRYMKISVAGEGGSVTEPTYNIDETARKAEELLGIKVTIGE
ncbi:MAG: DNA polymerase III subunit gamma/tau [Eubacterium sp.]|nr:DNA polymerase III subunit gamma/tau [Candidatus Colimonas fimequi]